VGELFAYTLRQRKVAAVLYSTTFHLLYVIRNQHVTYLLNIMSDARSLLRRAKAAETEKRISHPLALYNTSGQLRCAACGTAIKPHAWDGHVGSKAHRTQAARLRAEEERARKRKVVEQEVEEVDDQEDAEGKRRRVDQPESVELSPAQPEAAPAGGFPADFFSDPSRAPPVAEVDDEADEAMPPPSAPNPSSLDDEFAAFAKAVLQPAKAVSADVYDQATVMAEPELVNHVAGGIPASVTGAAPDTDGAQEEVEEETEGQKRQRLQQEDRELIMDRLRDEESAQEEADDRVTRLKARLEAVRLGRTQKPAGMEDTPMTSAPSSGVDKKTLLKMLRGKKKAPPS
jgi:zinc finger protein 830